MYDDANDAQARHHQRQAFRRRWRDSQREDLIAAARVLIPQHGLAFAIGRIGIHAGLTRHAAEALFNATTDLATVLVRQALMVLLEVIATPTAATAEDFVARLIAAIRADAPAHRIQMALGCGGLPWQHEIIDAAERLLVLSVEDCLTAVWPDLPADGSTGLGRRALVLARQAALAPDAPDAHAEAAVIASMLAADFARLAPAPVEAPATPAPPEPPAVWIRQPDHRAPVTDRAAIARPAHAPPDRVHDPPAYAV